MKFSKENSTEAKKNLIILSIIFGGSSLVMFIPQIRELIIKFGEILIGRSLTHEVWHSRFLKWEMEFLLLILFVILISFFEKKIESIFKQEKLLNYISIVLVLFSSVFLIITSCLSDDVWLDETFSLGLAQHNIKDLVSLTAQDVHPPLYYLILKIAMIIFPGSVTVAKIVSAIPVIIVLCISHIFFSKEFSCKYSIFFNLLLLSYYSVMQYAVEIRMYSWCLLFCMLCCICSYYIIQKGNLKYFLLYVLFAEFGAYCQYWTAFGLAINFMLISILCIIKNKKLIRNILISAVLGVVLYLPWISVVIRQVSQVSESYWIAPITFKTFLGYFNSITPMNGILKFVAVIILLLCAKNCISEIFQKNPSALFYLCCLLTPVLLIVCATIISLLMRPVFQAKYVFPLTIFVIFFIVFAYNEYKLPKKALLFVLLTSLLCTTINMKESFSYEKALAQINNDFEKFMNEKVSENTVFVFGENVNEHIPPILAYLYPKNKVYNIEISEMWDSAIHYDRKNLIKSLDDVNNICYVINLEDEPYEEFKESSYYNVQIGTYPPMRFYFRQ